jgi:hypothetical protein
MNRRIQSVVSAAITLLIFTALPLYAPSQLSPDLESIVSQAGIDLTGFVSQIAWIGVVIAALTLVKGFVVKHSPLYLLASVASSTVTLAFTLITLSLGDWGNLGVTTISMDLQDTTNTIVLDLSVFVKLAAVSVSLEVIHSILEFADARKERSKSPEQTEKLSIEDYTLAEEPQVVFGS